MPAPPPVSAPSPMSSYFVNPLYSKYKAAAAAAAAAAGEPINPPYYDCHFAPEVSGRHAAAAAAAALLYGNGAAAAGFQHAAHGGAGGGGGAVADFYHPAGGSPTAAYQPPPPPPAAPPPPAPCSGVTCHGEPAKFYGYDNLQRQQIFTTQQEAELVQYPDCKSSSANIGEEPDHLNQSSSPAQMFPWMRPQGWTQSKICFHLTSEFETLFSSSRFFLAASRSLPLPSPLSASLPAILPPRWLAIIKRYSKQTETLAEGGCHPTSGLKVSS